VTKDERTLLLTVARLMLVKIKDEDYDAQADDFSAICEALKPFDPSPTAPINERPM